MTIDDTARKRLLSLARTAIGIHLHDDDLELPTDFKDPVYAEHRGVFVKLYLNGELRGGLGSISPERAIAQAVVENAVASAFGDPRFPPVTEADFADLIIEISVASVPELIIWQKPEQLFSALTPDLHGVVLKKGTDIANFFPQMWSQFPDPQSFLEQLSLKAGLEKEAWQTATLKKYTLEKFSDYDFL